MTGLRSLAVVLSGAWFLAGGLRGLAASEATWPPTVSVIPKPVKVELRPGVFTLSPATRVLADRRAMAEAAYLGELIRTGTGFDLKVAAARRWAAVPGAILLTTRRADRALGAEGYELDIGPDAVVIRAPQPAGLFYGVQTLRQLFPPELDARQPGKRPVAWQAPCARIVDRPRYAWRGFLLDSARCFHSREFVLRFLDVLAALKMNVLHWHFTDDEAWRPELPSHPELVSAATNAPWWSTQSQGYYRAQDMRDIVAHAKSRHITIVPEVELPGHSAQVVARIPGTRCQMPDGTDVPVGAREFCLGSEASLAFLRTALVEIMDLFRDSPYIHIGGDEADPTRWKQCPRCRARMQAIGTDNPLVLQKWFVSKLAELVHARGRTTVAWADHLELGIPAGQIVHGWHAGESDYAVRHGFRTISGDNGYTYFDYPQGADEPSGGWMPALPLERVYRFNPDPAGMMPEQSRLVLGTQAHLWAVAQDRVFRKSFPRLLALCEVAWTPQEQREYSEFLVRARQYLARLEQAGIEYYPAPELCGHHGLVKPERLVGSEAAPYPPRGSRSPN